MFEEPIHVTDETYEQAVLKSQLPVIVDFWAPWCGPCKMLGPLLDQAAKYFVTLKFGLGGSMDLIPGILRITYHTNSGGAFSMLDDYTMILTIVSAVVIVGIIVLIIATKWSGFGKFSLALILGGAVGNLIDRLVLKYVVDMFYPLFVNFVKTASEK